MKNNILEKLKEIVFSDWNAMRILRLIIGVLILIQGINMNEWIMIILSSTIMLQAIFNTGCCSSGSCYNNTKTDIKISDEIKFEEITKK